MTVHGASGCLHTVTIDTKPYIWNVNQRAAPGIVGLSTTIGACHAPSTFFPACGGRHGWQFVGLCRPATTSSRLRRRATCHRQHAAGHRRTGSLLGISRPLAALVIVWRPGPRQHARNKANQTKMESKPPATARPPSDHEENIHETFAPIAAACLIYCIDGDSLRG